MSKLLQIVVTTYNSHTRIHVMKSVNHSVAMVFLKRTLQLGGKDPQVYLRFYAT